MVIHTVFFRYRPTSTPDQIEEVESAIARLVEEVPGVGRFQAGSNVSPESRGHGHGYEWGFVMTFSDIAARDAYIAHPAYAAAAALVEPVVEAAMVYDIGA